MKRVLKSGLSIWKFSNTPNGMLIEKNGNDLGVHPNFIVTEDLDGDYLMEVAMNFEDELQYMYHGDSVDGWEDMFSY